MVGWIVCDGEADCMHILAGNVTLLHFRNTAQTVLCAPLIIQAVPPFRLLLVLYQTDTVIDLKATLVNTGNVRLRQLAWTHDWSATYTWTSCSLGAAGALAPSVDLVPDIPVGQQLECVGTYTVTQAIMEEGAAKAISAVVALKVTDALAALPLPGGAVTVVSIPVTITPELTVTVLDTSCVKPFRAGVVLLNTSWGYRGSV